MLIRRDAAAVEAHRAAALATEVTALTVTPEVRPKKRTVRIPSHSEITGSGQLGRCCHCRSISIIASSATAVSPSTSTQPSSGDSVVLICTGKTPEGSRRM